jgi:hypothetical protein
LTLLDFSLFGRVKIPWKNCDEMAQSGVEINNIGLDGERTCDMKSIHCPIFLIGETAGLPLLSSPVAACVSLGA